MTRKTGKEMAEQLSEFINVATWMEKEEFVDAIMSEHRALQQDAFSMFMSCIDGWASLYNSGQYDGRNERACEYSKKMIDSIYK
jgi:hypothetical protein